MGQNKSKNDEEEIDIYEPRNKLISRDANSATSSTDPQELKSVIESDAVSAPPNSGE